MDYVDPTNYGTLDLTSIDPEQFEALVEAIFRAKSSHDSSEQDSSTGVFGNSVVSVSRSGKGPDDGKDLVVTTFMRDCVLAWKFKWLVQCKHKASNNKSVQLSDFKDNPQFVETVSQHGADGYLLICSTRPARNLKNRLDALNDNSANRYRFVIWDGPRISEEAHRHPHVIQVFFPSYYSLHYSNKEMNFDNVMNWIRAEGLSSEQRAILRGAVSRVSEGNELGKEESTFSEE